MVDSLPLPLPSDFGELRKDKLYIIPTGIGRPLLNCCGSVVDGVPVNGANTASGKFHRVDYISRPFPAEPGGVIRVAPRPEGCPGGCSGPCVHRRRYDSENLYHLFNADG